MDAATPPFRLLGPNAAPLPRLLAAALEFASGLSRLRREHAAIERRLGRRAAEPGAWLHEALEWLALDVDLPDGDLDRVPATGGVLVTADHPTGAMEGILLLALLRQRRPDVKVLANRWLMQLPALRGIVLPVDVYGRGNAAAVRGALRHLRAGGLLLAFPSGEVARQAGGGRPSLDAPWQAATAGLQRHAAVPVVPLHVRAANPAWFHLAGRVHRHLRTALLPRALLAQRGARVAVRIGRPIPSVQLERFRIDDRARIDYLRLRTEILARRAAGPRAALPRTAAPQPVATRVPDAWIEAEIAALPERCRLLEGNGMQVFVARAPMIPLVLQEIGRLRELTFRGVGEGSGSPRDLDAFDRHYEHLFVWDPAQREVVGAYRLGRTDELLAAGGDAELYTSAFYRFAAGFWQRVSPALELGRSFVQPRYQKGFAPLLLLWRGIGAFVARHPRYRRLFGTVSISADHHATSVRLMVDHLRTHCLATELAPLVASRRPWRADDGGGPRWNARQIEELQDVSAMVRELEVGRAGVPILLEQYLKLGARLLGVSVDPAFHTIDALVIVDLLRAPPHLQERYLGADGARILRGFHRDDVGALA